MCSKRRDILPRMSIDQFRPQVGVGVIFVRDARVFLGQRIGLLGNGTWGSAGGHLEAGESLEDCARREALEELKVIVGDLRYLCVSNIIAYGRHYLDVEFLGDIGDQEPFLMEPDNFSQSDWFSLDNLPGPLFQAVSYALDSLKNGRHYYPGS